MFLSSLFPPLLPNIGRAHRASSISLLVRGVCEKEEGPIGNSSYVGPQLSPEQGALIGNLDLEEGEIDPFSSSSLWDFPSPALNKADSRWLSAADTS